MSTENSHTSAPPTLEEPVSPATIYYQVTYDTASKPSERYSFETRIDGRVPSSAEQSAIVDAHTDFHSSLEETTCQSNQMEDVVYCQKSQIPGDPNGQWRWRIEADKLASGVERKHHVHVKIMEEPEVASPTVVYWLTHDRTKAPPDHFGLESWVDRNSASNPESPAFRSNILLDQSFHNALVHMRSSQDPSNFEDYWKRHEESEIGKIRGKIGSDVSFIKIPEIPNRSLRTNLTFSGQRQWNQI
nr:uncharacterized protein CI109_006336 [Kwoniella shandongensis]KAA5525357.1 hypothetical protein CI109_006336 [Kwoniella shandongensis]